MERRSETQQIEKKKLSEFFDMKAAILAAFSMGTLISITNLIPDFPEKIEPLKDCEHVIDSITAGVKQSLYTLIFGGFLGKLCRNYAEKDQPIKAVAIPSVITAIATSILHTLKGTPDPISSISVATIASVAGFWYWSKKKK